MNAHLVCVGGEDHHLRIPFLLALRERGFRVTAISSGPGSAFSSNGLPHHRLAFDRFGAGNGDRRALRTVRDLIRKLQPDVVQSFDTKPNLLMPLALRGGVPVVRTINGLGWVFSSFEAKALALRPLFCGLQWLARHWTAMTVFQNRDDQTFFERYRLVEPDKGRLIRSSGIDVDGFAAATRGAPSVAKMRDQLGLQSAEVVIFVGRLTLQKGIPTLLKAIPRVVSERPNARFLLVGPRDSEGPFAVKQGDIDGHFPYVVALGARRDIPALLGLSDVFVFPTQYREGVPRVLLEAGLAGLPIVASRMPGCNDVVEDGWNGYLVAPGNAEALASRIVDVLSDRARAKVMGARSVGFVRERFALATVVDQYCDLYEGVLGCPVGSDQPHPGSAASMAKGAGRLNGARQ